jgi:cytochrome P450
MNFEITALNLRLTSEQTDSLISALLQQNEDRIISDMHLAYSCYTVDIISDYCFAQSPDALSSPNLRAPIVEAFLALSDSWCAMKHFPVLQKINSLPTWLTIRLAPAMRGLVEYQTALQVQIRDLISNPEKLQQSSHPIIYETLLADDADKGTPLDFMELDHEAQSVVAAGVDTTAVSLVTGTYMLLKDPSKVAKLKQELKSAWPSLASTPPGLEALERLPYLAAVIKESLRMAPHITAGFPRVVPFGGKTIGGIFIPGGVRIISSAHITSFS